MLMKLASRPRSGMHWTAAAADAPDASGEMHLLDTSMPRAHRIDG